MEIFLQIFEAVKSILDIRFTLFGYTLSLWNVFAFTFVTGIISYVVGEVIDVDW